jgi:hypothetical protein
MIDLASADTYDRIRSYLVINEPRKTQQPRELRCTDVQIK